MLFCSRGSDGVESEVIGLSGQRRLFGDSLVLWMLFCRSIISHQLFPSHPFLPFRFSLYFLNMADPQKQMQALSEEYQTLQTGTSTIASLKSGAGHQ